MQLAYCQLQELLLEEFRNKSLLATPAAADSPQDEEALSLSSDSF
jgi:hypothetical protein